MISVAEATERILNKQVNFGVERLPLRQSYGRILAEDLSADRDFPPFTRVAMDGIAIAYEDFARGVRTFSVQGVVAAGTPKTVLERPRHCLEVMTGAILPEKTDTVIRYEDLEIKDGLARICTENVRKGQNAHLQGNDRAKGDLIVPAGKKIGPGETGVAATIGKTHILVRRLPNVLIIYTGDELVDIDRTPQPHQIRASNAFTLDALLSDWKIEAEIIHLTDSRHQIQHRLKSSLEHYDLILLSGGISKGKFDFIPEILERLNVQKQFGKVQQRPGKPFWFGYTPDTTVFAFPGNPVSAFVCACRYLIPWLRQNLGLPPFDPIFSSLTETFHHQSPLTYFLPVKIAFSPNGRCLSTPQSGHGSGDLANLTDADGFLELPPGPRVINPDEAFPMILYR